MKRQADIDTTPTPQMLAGVALSDRKGDTTTVWRDGQVWREDAWGRSRELASVRPVKEAVK